MKQFKNKQDLQRAFSKQKGEADNILACMVTKYMPHIYRGGYLIEGFGYSTERITAGFTTKESCGVPA